MNKFKINFSKWHFLITMVLLGATHAFSSVSEEHGPMRVAYYDSTESKVMSASPYYTFIDGIILDGFAQVELQQHFINEASHTIQPNYVFPLPENGSVHGLVYEVGGKTYKAEIKEKGEAKDIFDSVQKDGNTAGLLLEHRPNVFQFLFANLGAGDTLRVQIELSIPLKFLDGKYEFSFPTMIGSRFPSSEADYIQGTNSGWNPAENVQGPSLGMRLLMNTGFSLDTLVSPTHNISVNSNPGLQLLREQKVLTENQTLDLPNSALVGLAEGVTYPNRDIVVRFGPQSFAKGFSLAQYKKTGSEEGCFIASIYPDMATIDERDDLELLVLFDRSGSQGGWPLQKQKEAAITLINQLGEGDDLQVIIFDNVKDFVFSGMVPANSVNKETAISAINNVSARGGTELLDAIQSALAEPLGGKKRIYAFMTDGFITNEEAILNELKTADQELQVFTFGMGNNINRYFLEETAKIGNGFAVEVLENESAKDYAMQAWERVTGAQLDNIKASFEGVTLEDVVYPYSRKLYTGQVYNVFGKYTGSKITGAELTAEFEGNSWSQSYTSSTGTYGLGWSICKMWARQKINQLVLTQDRYQEENKASIIDLSVAEQVLSPYTAFIAYKTTDETVDWNNVTVSVEEAFIGQVQGVSLVLNAKELNLEWDLSAGFEVLKIYNLKGEVVFEMRVENLNEVLADLNKLTKGTYWVVLEGNGSSFKERINIK